MFCNAGFHADFQCLSLWDGNFYVLPTEISQCIELLLLCFVDLTSLAIDLHFELDFISGSRMTSDGNVGFGWCRVGLIKEVPNVSCAHSDVGLILIILAILLAGWCWLLEDVPML